MITKRFAWCWLVVLVVTLALPPSCKPSSIA